MGIQKKYTLYSIRFKEKEHFSCKTKNKPKNKNSKWRQDFSSKLATKPQNDASFVMEFYPTCTIVGLSKS